MLSNTPQQNTRTGQWSSDGQRYFQPGVGFLDKPGGIKVPNQSADDGRGGADVVNGKVGGQNPSTGVNNNQNPPQGSRGNYTQGPNGINTASVSGSAPQQAKNGTTPVSATQSSAQQDPAFTQYASALAQDDADRELVARRAKDFGRQAADIIEKAAVSSFEDLNIDVNDPYYKSRIGQAYIDEMRSKLDFLKLNAESKLSGQQQKDKVFAKGIAKREEIRANKEARYKQRRDLEVAAGDRDKQAAIGMAIANMTMSGSMGSSFATHNISSIVSSMSDKMSRRLQKIDLDYGDALDKFDLETSDAEMQYKIASIDLSQEINLDSARGKVELAALNSKFVAEEEARNIAREKLKRDMQEHIREEQIAILQQQAKDLTAAYGPAAAQGANDMINKLAGIGPIAKGNYSNNGMFDNKIRNRLRTFSPDASKALDGRWALLTPEQQQNELFNISELAESKTKGYTGGRRAASMASRLSERFKNVNENEFNQVRNAIKISTDSQFWSTLASGMATESETNTAIEGIVSGLNGKNVGKENIALIRDVLNFYTDIRHDKFGSALTTMEAGYAEAIMAINSGENLSGIIGKLDSTKHNAAEIIKAELATVSGSRWEDRINREFSVGQQYNTSPQYTSEDEKAWEQYQKENRDFKLASDGFKHPQKEEVTQIATAISQFESGTNYSAVGPKTKSGDRAYGRYQIMGFNIPSWSKQAIGRKVSLAEFKRTPEIQDAIALHKMGQYFTKHNNLDDVASLWFSGKTMKQAGYAKDVIGTSVPQYIANVRAIYERNKAKDVGAKLSSNFSDSFLPHTAHAKGDITGAEKSGGTGGGFNGKLNAFNKIMRDKKEAALNEANGKINAFNGKLNALNSFLGDKKGAMLNEANGKINAFNGELNKLNSFLGDKKGAALNEANGKINAFMEAANTSIKDGVALKNKLISEASSKVSYIGNNIKPILKDSVSSISKAIYGTTKIGALDHFVGGAALGVAKKTTGAYPVVKAQKGDTVRSNNNFVSFLNGIDKLMNDGKPFSPTSQWTKELGVTDGENIQPFSKNVFVEMTRKMMGGSTDNIIEIFDRGVTPSDIKTPSAGSNIKFATKGSREFHKFGGSNVHRSDMGNFGIGVMYQRSNLPLHLAAALQLAASTLVSKDTIAEEIPDLKFMIAGYMMAQKTKNITLEDINTFLVPVNKKILNK